MMPYQRSGLLRYKRGNTYNMPKPPTNHEDKHLAQKLQAEEDEKLALKLAREQEEGYKYVAYDILTNEKKKNASSGKNYDKKSSNFISDQKFVLNPEQLYEEIKINPHEQIKLDEEIAKEIEQQELANSKKSNHHQKNRYDPSFDNTRSFMPPRHNHNHHRAVYSSNPLHNSHQRGSDPWDNQSYEQLLELDKDMYNKGNGIKTYELDAIPISQYNSSNNKEESTCNICLEDFQDGETIIRLPCMHIFHKNCGDDWLERKNSCPICKISVIEH
ncbi:unnamed protein product [Blepharisma stoltei]|uniref:RING-type E3 ubiquitin transferase n=1 Tax=Blepharisma stoltei TaxID=1481888 RepID=A0AAU9J566_9CILI|nr:unnamed protein product [Blepharisma stoltei]